MIAWLPWPAHLMRCLGWPVAGNRAWRTRLVRWLARYHVSAGMAFAVFYVGYILYGVIK